MRGQHIVGFRETVRSRYPNLKHDSWSFDAKQLVPVALVAYLSAVFVPSFMSGRAPETALAILDAGVERSEDAPFASPEYRFYPGDYLYCRFQIAGFAIQLSEPGEVRKISLAYEITPQDAHGAALTTPVADSIETELNAEDKNWTPKRRASFLLPSFIAAGEFRLHIVVKDLIAKTQTERDLPFRVGGVLIVPSSTITVENFQFFRKEEDKEPLELPAYSPGDTVFARFDMAGFQLAPENKYHLAYGLTVLAPDGKTFVESPAAAELGEGSFYPAPFVPGNIGVITKRDSARGQYLIVLNVKDLVSGRSCQVKRAFHIE